MVLLYAPSHRQNSTYHSLCYTSCGALAGTKKYLICSTGQECYSHSRLEVGSSDHQGTRKPMFICFTFTLSVYVLYPFSHLLLSYVVITLHHPYKLLLCNVILMYIVCLICEVLNIRPIDIKHCYVNKLLKQFFVNATHQRQKI